MNHWHFIAPPNEIVEKTLGIARCGRCGWVLTDPESVAKGVGPVCEEHGVAKSFPGHKGRPGKVGGSLPRGVGSGAKAKRGKELKRVNPRFVLDSRTVGKMDTADIHRIAVALEELLDRIKSGELSATAKLRKVINDSRRVARNELKIRGRPRRGARVPRKARARYRRS